MLASWAPVTVIGTFGGNFGIFYGYFFFRGIFGIFLVYFCLFFCRYFGSIFWVFCENLLGYFFVGILGVFKDTI